MARIRTVKPELFRHLGLYNWEKTARMPLRLAFIGLFTAADRAGRFKWSPKELKLDCLPYDDNVDFELVLKYLVEGGFIVKYEVDGREYGCIPSWESHQVINNREQDSKIPAMQGIVDACPTRDPRPLIFPQGEGKGREGKGKDKPLSASADPAKDGDFMTFWRAWPKSCRRGTPKKAYGAWCKHKPPLQACLDTLAWKCKSKIWTDTDAQGKDFIPMPSSWLNDWGWTEEKESGRGRGTGDGGSTTKYTLDDGML